MPRFAQFDATVAQPAPVLGWYDTDLYDYPNLPAASDLLEMTDAQWAARMPGPFAVQGGALIAYSPPAPVVPLAVQAQHALDAVTMSCWQRFGMIGQPLPQAWISYNQALQAIIAGSSAATALPVPPA